MHSKRLSKFTILHDATSQKTIIWDFTHVMRTWSGLIWLRIRYNDIKKRLRYTFSFYKRGLDFVTNGTDWQTFYGELTFSTRTWATEVGSGRIQNRFPTLNLSVFRVVGFHRLGAAGCNKPTASAGDNERRNNPRGRSDPTGERH